MLQPSKDDESYKAKKKEKDDYNEKVRADSKQYIRNFDGIYEENDAILEASGHLESLARKKMHAAWVSNLGATALEYRMSDFVKVAIRECGVFQKVMMDKDEVALKKMTSRALFNYMKKHAMNPQVKLEALDFHETGGYRVDNIVIRDLRGRTQDKHAVIAVEVMIDCMLRLKVTMDGEVIMPGDEQKMCLGMSFVSRLPSDGKKIKWKIYGVETVLQQEDNVDKDSDMLHVHKIGK